MPSSRRFGKTAPAAMKLDTAAPPSPKPTPLSSRDLFSASSLEPEPRAHLDFSHRSNANHLSECRRVHHGINACVVHMVEKVRRLGAEFQSHHVLQRNVLVDPEI